MMWYGGLGYGYLGMFFMITFWVALIWLIFVAIEKLTKNNESSREILEKRYAKGEITKIQYLEMKKELGR